MNLSFSYSRLGEAFGTGQASLYPVLQETGRLAHVRVALQ